MARRNPFHRIRLVYRRSPLLLKILVLVTILASTAALLALRASMKGYQDQRQVLYNQAVSLQQENADLTDKLENMDSVEGIQDIAEEELGLVDPDTVIFIPDP